MSVLLATDNDLQQQLQANDKVIIKYYADWCGSCKLIAPNFKRLSDDERFKGIAFLEVNAEKNPDARKLGGGVDNLPYFAVFKGGNLVASDGGSKEEFIVDMLQKLN